MVRIARHIGRGSFAAAPFDEALPASLENMNRSPL